ncbi:hypothetical protein AAG570_010041 [Ranatra chinensis]|uniref:Uncharacterized protein n=1 Tax=Ranatra chinensis TaxID=642074 RepID=A0ABD0Z7K9_9HEMI
MATRRARYPRPEVVPVHGPVLSTYLLRCGDVDRPSPFNYIILRRGKITVGYHLLVRVSLVRNGFAIFCVHVITIVVNYDPNSHRRRWRLDETQSKKRQTTAMLNVEQGAELLDNFLRLQKEIWKQEKHPPIPALARLIDQLGLATHSATRPPVFKLSSRAVPPFYENVVTLRAMFHVYGGHWVAVLDKIGAELEAAVGETSGDMQVMPGTVPQTDQHTQPPQQKLPSGYEVWDEPILKVMRELSIANSPARALEHEEFIANLTRYV